MSNLKTLEDIGCCSSMYLSDLPIKKQGFEECREKIRQSAIEWIKELEQARKKCIIENERGTYEDVDVPIGEIYISARPFADDEAKPVINFLKAFFNITEEELK